MKTKWPSYAAFDPEYSHDDGDLLLWMISLRTSANAMNHCSRSVNRSRYSVPFFLVSVWTALSSGDHTSRFESGGVVCGIASKSCLRNGKGVPKDDAEAVQWYRLAAEQGHAFAQLSLGFMYANPSPTTSCGMSAKKEFSCLPRG